MFNRNRKQLVSIITPCYNDNRFISECIESVLNQDYPYIEHVVQDGGSTDGTLELIGSYADRFPNKIKYASGPDEGQADGLNKAIQRSKGDILLVLNADDCLLPHAALWAVRHLMENQDVAVVYGDVYIMDENSKIIEEFRTKPYDFEKLLCVELVPPAQAAFIRRSHFEKAGFYADKTLDTCPDYEMWVRIGLKFPMKYVPGFVTKYRRHNRPLDSKSIRTVQRFIESKKLVMDRVFDAPRTSKHIKELRQRAYGGLNMWAAVTEFGLHGKDSKKKFDLYAITLLVKSVISHYNRVSVRNFQVYLIIYLKRFIRKISKAFFIFLPKKLTLMILKIGDVSDFHQAFYIIQQKNLEELTALEKWQKLLCECLLERDSKEHINDNVWKKYY